jgi:hypothetical protein
MGTLNENKWIILSALELVIILLLLYRLRKFKRTSPETDEIRKSKDSSIDMDDMMRDIYLSAELHKKLSRICHPDRFVNTSLTSLANEIFQELQLYKNNYSKLLELEEIITNELQIHR